MQNAINVAHEKKKKHETGNKKDRFFYRVIERKYGVTPVKGDAEQRQTNSFSRCDPPSDGCPETNATRRPSRNERLKTMQARSNRKSQKEAWVAEQTEPAFRSTELGKEPKEKNGGKKKRGAKSVHLGLAQKVGTWGIFVESGRRYTRRNPA